MRIAFFALLLCCSSINAQSPEAYCKSVNDIAMMERIAHERLTNGAEQTQASNNFEIKYYRCEWEVDPAFYYITGKVTAYFVMTGASSSITFDLMSSMTVDSVKQRGVLLGKLQSNNTVQVNFASSINAGVLDSVSIYYKGPPANTGFGSFVQTSHAGAPVIWTLSEPYGSRDWWPCRNGLDDKIDSIDILVTYPAVYKGAANGLLQSETLLPGGTKKQAWWKHRYPIATYLVCFSVTNFAMFNSSVQLGNTNLPMQTFCWPENLASFQSGTINTLNALQLYHNTFGPYPFINEKYGHVQFGWGGGMEHQTSTFVVSIDENLCAHELGHQWFGDKITCGSWEDIWLNESFATFLADFYYENKYPANVLQFRRNEINFITSQPGGSVWVDDTTNVGRIFDSRLSYNKGSHVLAMLRFKLGDSTFFRGIRQYQQDPKLAYGFARTPDLERNLEQASGKDLTQFFKDWFKGQGYPSYNVEWSPIGSDYVRIKVSQTTSHASVSFFALPVPLKFKNAAKEKTIVVDNVSNGEIFIRNIGFVPDSVFIDPDLWLISKNNVATKVIDPSPYGVKVFPNPVGSQFYVSFSKLASPTANINLYNSIGQRVYSRTVTLLNGSEYIEIPSTQLPSGVYTIRIQAGDEVKFTKKLLK
ncbi:MAG TPA: M1 family aminopeptidase [Ferruginibacter sp.]|nr:M1 family aminopeptidase [Ferruginibacter sp.]